MVAKKVKPFKLDAGSQGELQTAMSGVDAVVNLTLIDFNDDILQAAISAGVHYLDTANHYDYLAAMVKGDAPLGYDQEFKAKGKTALMGCGLTPGITNAMARYVCDQMDTVEKIFVRCAGKSLEASPEIVSAWDPGWSPEIALLDFAEKPMTFQGGQYKQVPIFSRPEAYRFADPVGECLLASHSHEEPYTLPYYIGKGLKEVDFKYPVDILAGAFVKMGFADDRKIEIDGVEVCPRDVLMKLVSRPANDFLEESLESLEQEPEFAWVMEVEVTGTRENKLVKHQIIDNTVVDRRARQEVFKTFGCTHIGVALPAAAGLLLCLAGKTETGVISSECLNPVTFFKTMAEMGVPQKFEEKIEMTTQF